MKRDFIPAMVRRMRYHKPKEEHETMNEQFYIIRAKDAGVFFGHIKERSGDEVVLTECRRIWYWKGAASISQLATEGVKEPRLSKFTVTVPEMTVLGVIEIIPCSDEAVASIRGVAEWRM